MTAPISEDGDTDADESGILESAARFLRRGGLFRNDDPRTQRVLLVLYRLIAMGEPVAVDRLADSAGTDADAVRDVLAAVDPSNIQYDDGRVVGFRGLTQIATRHRLTVGDHALYTWCAFDALFVPELLDRPARVASACPMTGTEIRLTVTPGGVSAVAPAETVMSFVMPDDPHYRADIRATFCRHVNFLASKDAGVAWRAANPEAVILTLDEAHALGRIRNQVGFGDALERDG